MLRIVATALVFSLAALPAQARQACPDHKQVTDHLADQYQEAPVAMGLANNGGVIEVFSTETGTTWTILITMPSGKTCMIAAGESWEILPAVFASNDPEA